MFGSVPVNLLEGDSELSSRTHTATRNQQLVEKLWNHNGDVSFSLLLLSSNASDRGQATPHFYRLCTPEGSSGYIGAPKPQIKLLLSKSCQLLSFKLLSIQLSRKMVSFPSSERDVSDAIELAVLEEYVII